MKVVSRLFLGDKICVFCIRMCSEMQTFCDIGVLI